MKYLLYADIHLSSRNRAKHRSYPDESLHYFQFITEQAEQLNVDGIIGLGDISYGTFTNLKFRDVFEQLLDRQIAQTKGERYELRGNHDDSSAGYSEYDFYVSRGKIKPSQRLVIGNVVIEMLDYGAPIQYDKEGGKKIHVEAGKKHIVLSHDFLRFRESKISGYGNAYIIEDLQGLKGAEWLICGHVHDMLSDRGMIYGGTECNLFYPGAMCRPVSKGDFMEKAALVVIDTEAVEDYVQIYEVDLLPVEQSFDLQRVAKAKEDKLRKQEIQIAAGELRDAVRSIAPDGERRTAYDIIATNKQVTIEVRDKALEYLKNTGMDK